MLPWKLIDSAQVPGNGGELCLYRRGKEYSLRVDGFELMNSRVHGSEDALSELACAKIKGRPQPRVLIGGLGIGYTLASALQHLGTDALVDVAELVPAVVQWNRGPLSDLAGHPLEDKRTTVHEVDVASMITGLDIYNAILLDVDNGPDGLTRKSNAWLYTRAGLEAALAALKSGGVLAIWSAGPDQTFAPRLRRVGFKVDEVRVRARSQKKGGWHTIWVAEKP